MRGPWNGGGAGTGFTLIKVLRVNPPAQLDPIQPGNQLGNHTLATNVSNQISATRYCISKEVQRSTIETHVYSHTYTYTYRQALYTRNAV